MRYTLPFNGIPVHIDLDADPGLGDACYDAPGSYTDGPYEIAFATTPLNDESLLLDWQLRRLDGQPFDITRAHIAAAVPGIDLHRVFVPVLHDAISKLNLISLPWSVQERTFTSWSFPFIAALNRFDRTPEGLEVRTYDRGLVNTSVAQHTVSARAVDIDLSVEIGGALELAILN